MINLLAYCIDFLSVFPKFLSFHFVRRRLHREVIVALE